MAYIVVLVLCIAVLITLLAVGFSLSPRVGRLFGSIRNILHKFTPAVISVGIFLVVALIGLMSYASIHSINKFQQNAKLVAHSNAVIASINELRIDSANGASIERGALISGSQAYRDAFNTYQVKTQTDAAKLLTSVSDNRTQAARAKQVVDILSRRFAGWQQTIDQSKEGFNYERAAAEVNQNLASSTQLRDLFVDMDQSENMLLAARHSDFDRSSRQTMTVLGTATAVSALMALVIFGVIIFERRSIMREQRRSHELQQEQKELLAKMKEQTKHIAAQRVRDRAILKSLGEGLIATDEYGYVTSVNPAALEMLGYSQKELMGKWYIKTIQAMDDEGRPVDPLERPMTLAVSSGKPVATVTNFRRRDGSTFPTFVTVAPVLLRGKPVGAVEVFRDIARERELDRAKDEFVSLASHQLRTPAAGVKAFASMLLDGYGGSITPQQREFLQQIYDSNERQLRIVEDLLSVARVDAGRMVLNRSEVNVATLVGEVAMELFLPMQVKGQKLEVKTKGDTPLISADADKLKMVVDNLISNASKYTPSNGTITVKVSATHSRLQISVHDTGIGIAKTDLPGLFKKFSRIQNELSETVSGTGLGLYLAHQIVRMHGGSIGVTSELGKGSTFTVKLPLSRQLLYRQSKGAKSHETPPVG